MKLRKYVRAERSDLQLVLIHANAVLVNPFRRDHVISFVFLETFRIIDPARQVRAPLDYGHIIEIRPMLPTAAEMSRKE